MFEKPGTDEDIVMANAPDSQAVDDLRNALTKYIAQNGQLSITPTPKDNYIDTTNKNQMHNENDVISPSTV